MFVHIAETPAKNNSPDIAGQEIMQVECSIGLLNASRMRPWIRLLLVNAIGVHEAYLTERSSFVSTSRLMIASTQNKKLALHAIYLLGVSDFLAIIR